MPRNNLSARRQERAEGLSDKWTPLAAKTMRTSIAGHNKATDIAMKEIEKRRKRKQK